MSALFNGPKRKIYAALVVVALQSCASYAFAYTENTLHRFCTEPKCADGSKSHDLVWGQSGILYGTTSSGGAHGAGTVFQFEPSTGAYQVLYDFCSKAGCSDGAEPYRVKLVIDTAENLYGTTTGGGTSNEGVVFELILGKSGWSEKVLYTFCSKGRCSDGGAPSAGLTYAGEGAGAPYDGMSPLYGTTTLGNGVVFEIRPKKSNPVKWIERVVYRFCTENACTDGLGPLAAVYLDNVGNLYGTTSAGGQFNQGTIFELIPSSDSYSESVLYSFCAETACVDGSNPEGPVVMDGAGNLFGTTTSGGHSNTGVLFKLVPQGGGLAIQYVGQLQR